MQETHQSLLKPVANNLQKRKSPVSRQGFFVFEGCWLQALKGFGESLAKLFVRAVVMLTCE
ncbi:hypothetical protein QCD79_33120, partial [Pseudomonas quasicaspiana]|nr:hypothetical protein [Pseudomonas quasicaspiana]